MGRRYYSEVLGHAKNAVYYKFCYLQLLQYLTSFIVSHDYRVFENVRILQMITKLVIIYYLNYIYSYFIYSYFIILFKVIIKLQVVNFERLL